MRDDVLISVVAPVFNEESVIADFVAITHGVLAANFANFELVLVDDGSSDQTVEVIRQLLVKYDGVRVVRLSRNYGRETALTAGLDSSIGDYVVVLDSDLQDPPELIPVMFERACEGYDVVVAARRKREGESLLKRITSKLFYRVATYMSGFHVSENAGDFRIFSRKVVNAILELKESNRYMKMLYAYVGFRWTSVDFDRAPRRSGVTKYNYAKLVGAALDAIVSFSLKPLRIVSFLSIGASVISLVAACYAIIVKFLTHGVADGWTSLFVLVSFLFCLLFIFLAVLAEYVGRALTEAKGRPLYFVTEEINSPSRLSTNIARDL